MKILPISTVRRKLFDLFEDVVSRGDVVVIRHRNREERAVLTSEAYLRSLERRAEAAADGGNAFRLFDSATLDVDPDRVLERTRREQADRSKKKRATV